jgi:hypothetical protein
MNEEKIALLEAVGFEWDRRVHRGRYDRSISSNEADTASEVPAEKSPPLAKSSPGVPTLPGGPHNDGVDGESLIPSDPTPTDRDSFNWCAQASLGNFLPSRAGDMTDRGLSVAVATAFGGVANTLNPSPASTDDRKRPAAGEVNQRPAKIDRLKGGGTQPLKQEPQQQQEQRGASNVTRGESPEVGTFSLDTEIVI